MLPVIDTRFFFRPAIAEIVARLRALAPEAWDRPTIAGRWRVRDVAAHLTDTALRRLSAQRDGLVLSARITSERELTDLINSLNAEWVRVAERFSPRVLTDLYQTAGGALADLMESLSLDADAFFPVSWSADCQGAAWLDIGREFTEVWHHGSQICDAVGDRRLSDAAWLHAVLTLALHAVPRAYADVPTTPARTVVIEITGSGGGTWRLHANDGRWDVDAGSIASPAARAVLSDDDAWRLFFNALRGPDAERAIRFEGDVDLTRPILQARSVIV